MIFFEQLGKSPFNFLAITTHCDPTIHLKNGDTGFDILALNVENHRTLPHIAKLFQSGTDRSECDSTCVGQNHRPAIGPCQSLPPVRSQRTAYVSLGRTSTVKRHLMV